MTSKKDSTIWKSAAVALFAILLSTFYFGGGNSLFFLSRDSLYVARMALFLLGTACFLVYLAKRTQPSDLVLLNDHQLHKKAYQKMFELGIREDDIKNAIELGDRKKIGENYRCLWSNESGISIAVYINDKGHVVDLEQ